MMQERKCYYCRRNNSEVEILDCILNDEPIHLCERCAVVSRAVIIRKPTEQQIASINKSQSVYERLRKAAGLAPLKKPEEERFRDKLKEIKPEEMRPRVWKTVEEKKELRAERIAEKFAETGIEESINEKSEEEGKFHLISNFSELVKKSRENKGMKQKELAENIAEPEQEIKEIERGKVPSNEKLIRKLEQFFRIKLLKESGDINFKSETLTIGELKKRKEELFRKAREIEEAKGQRKANDIEIIGIEEE